MMYKNSWLPEVFNDFINAVNLPKANATAPAINVLEMEDKYQVEVAAPGMTKEDFDVNINADGDLTIKMESRHEQTLILPDDVDKEKIGAKVADGVLTIDLPKIVKEEVKVARQINIG